MVCKIAVNVALILVTSCAAAAAADDQSPMANPVRGEISSQIVSAAATASATAALASTTAEAVNSAFQLPTAAPAPARGALLPSLYVSLAGLNAYDAVTTLKGISLGAKESNKAMSGVAGSPWAMVAVKSGVTTGSILVAERLWKSGHRGQAIGMMVASNAMMVFVGAHNSRVLGSQR